MLKTPAADDIPKSAIKVAHTICLSRSKQMFGSLELAEIRSVDNNVTVEGGSLCPKRLAHSHPSRVRAAVQAY